MRLKKIIFNYLLILFLYTFHAICLSQVTVDSCTLLQTFYYSQFEYTREPTDQIYIITSNNMLKTLNDSIFEGWTLASEYITTILHNSFIFHLNNILKTRNINAQIDSSIPYIKNLILHLQNSSLSHEQISVIVTQAKNLSIKTLQDILQTDTNQVNKIKSKVINIPHLNSYQFELLKNKIISKYQNINNFILFLNPHYGVGLALTKIDAYHAAKLSTLSQTTPGNPVFFDIVRLKQHLNNILNLRTKLKWLFANTNKNNLIEIFSQLRKNINKPIENWDTKFIALLQKYAQPHNITLNQEILYELKKYIDMLNLLDFLPIDSLPDTSALKIHFDTFTDTQYIIFIDMKNIGAHNLFILHNSAQSILKEIELLEAKLILLENNPNEENNTILKSEITKIYLDLINIRSNILQQTAKYMEQIRNNITHILTQLCSSHVMWYSGDDIYIKVKLNSQINLQQLLFAIKLNPNLKDTIRIAILNTKTKSRINLDQARIELSQASALLKISEKLGWDAIIVQQDENTHIYNYNPKIQNFEEIPTAFKLLLMMLNSIKQN